MRCVAVSLGIAVLVIAPAHATAQSAVEQARVYFDAAAQAYGAGRYDAAIEAFSEAYALVPKPQILFSLAQAERRRYTVEHEVRYLHDAIAHFRRYIEEVAEGGRRADAVEALAELEAVVVRLDIPNPIEPQKARSNTRILVSSSTKGAVVVIDGVEHRELPVLEAVNPGRHLVRISAPGYVDEEREMVAVDGALVPLEVVLRERPSSLALNAPAGALVTLDGRPHGQAPLSYAIDVTPGSHMVMVSQTGHVPYLAPVVVERGDTVALHVTLHPTKQRLVSLVVLGVGAAGLAAAGSLALSTLYQENMAQEIRNATTTGNITAAQLAEYNLAVSSRDALRTSSLAMLGVATGVTLVGLGLFALDDPRPAATIPRVGLTVLPGGLKLYGQF